MKKFAVVAIGLLSLLALNLYLIVINYEGLYSVPEYHLPGWIQGVVLSLVEEEKYPTKSIYQAMHEYDTRGRRKARVYGMVVDVKKAPDGDTHITIADGMFRMVFETDKLHPLPVPEVGMVILGTGMVSYDERAPCGGVGHGHQWFEIHPLLAWVELKPKKAKRLKRHLQLQ